MPHAITRKPPSNMRQSGPIAAFSKTLCAQPDAIATGPTCIKCPLRVSSGLQPAAARNVASVPRAGNGARKRHFQPVENPGDAKRYDDKSVEPSPAEPVEPRRDGGFDQRRVWLGPHSSVLVGYQQLVAQAYVDGACSAQNDEAATLYPLAFKSYHVPLQGTLRRSRHLQLLKRLEEPCSPHVAAVLRQGGKDVAVPFLPLR